MRLLLAPWFVLGIVALTPNLGCKPDAIQEAQDLAEQAAEAAQKAAEAAKKAAEVSGQAGNSDPGSDQSPKTAPQNLAEAMAQVTEALGKQGAVAEPVNFRELKAMLPEKLGDLPRTKAEGQKTGAFGFKVSTAHGRYGKGPSRVDLKVTDTGGAQALAGAAAAAWTVAEIDREWDTGYERTTTMGGHKAYEKFDNKTMRGEIQLVAGGRFMIEARGRKVKMEVLKEAIGALPLSDLEQKAKQAKTETADK